MNDRHHQAILELASSDMSYAAIMRELKISRSSKCAFCDSMVATLVCDFMLGASSWVLDGERKCFDINALHETCDAPICVKCSTNKGRIFICGIDGYTDTKDHCPIHADMDTLGNAHEFLTTGTAESIRLKSWKMKYFQRR